jgi:hypothetical protein
MEALFYSIVDMVLTLRVLVYFVMDVILAINLAILACVQKIWCCRPSRVDLVMDIEVGGSVFDPGYRRDNCMAANVSKCVTSLRSKRRHIQAVMAMPPGSNRARHSAAEDTGVSDMARDLLS